MLVPLFAVLAACGSNSTRPTAADAAITRDAVAAGEAAAQGSENTPATATSADAAAGETPVPRPEVPPEAAALFARALDAMAAGNRAEAERLLGELVLLHPDFAGPHVNLALVYREDGRDEAARAELERALAIDPNHTAANNALGMLHRENGDFEAAEAAYRRAIAGDPDYAFARYNLGVLLDLYLKREDEALEQYEIYQALQNEPDQEVGFWIVDIRRRLGLPPEPAQMAQEDGR